MEKKIILITWASSGIWKVTALKLAQQGHIVYAAARSINKMKDIQKQWWNIIYMDLSNVITIEHMVHTIIKKHKKIDILWNNAGIWLFGPVENIDITKAKTLFEVNLFGLAVLTQKVIPFMRNKRSGTIINTSSIGGLMYTPLGAWYHASKYALEWWSDCLRIELRDFNINVILIEPWVINTDFGNKCSKYMKESIEDSEYESFWNKIKKKRVNKKGDSKYIWTSPEVVSDLVVKVMFQENPKTRYTKWQLSYYILLRKYLGDKWFDKIISS